MENVWLLGDNLSAHSSKTLTLELKKTNLQIILNAPYSPECTKIIIY
jgi:transposase InsO family protein